MTKIEELFLESVNNGEVEKFLKGDWPYTVDLPQWTSTVLKTDVSRLLTEGVYAAFEDAQCVKAESILENGIIELLEGSNRMDIYTSVILFFNQIKNEKRGKSPFNVDRKAIIDAMRVSVNENKNELESYEEGYSVDLWKEIKRISQILLEDYDISLISY